MNEDTYRDKLTDLQLEVEELRAKLKESQEGDTISRQAAIDAVRKCSVKEVTPAYMLIDKPEAMTELMLLPSAQPKPQWIPCSERLPKNHENVLVCGVEALNNVHIYGVKCWDVDEWRPMSAPSCTWEAWMPLPEPYTERRTDDC